MKRYYRILALLLIAAALLMTGCGERDGEASDKKAIRLSDPVTAASLVEVMGRQLWRQQSAEFGVQASFDGAVDNGNGLMSIKADVDMQGELITTDIRLHVKGTVGMNMMGMNMDLPLELYGVQEPDALSLYIGIMGQWMNESVPMDEDEVNEALSQIPDFTLDEDALSHILLQEEKEMVGEKECYRLDFVLTQEELNELAGEISDLDEVSGISNLAVSVTLWVDAKTVLPARLSVNVNGPVETEKFNLQKFELLVDFAGFGTVEDITVPEQVFNSAASSNGAGFPL